MKILTQQLKSGKMEISEVPFPVLNKGQILVRNHYSVISAGTEGKTVYDARKGYISKALSRQKEVKMLIDMVKVEGLINTYNLAMNKLEKLSPLGYSCAGEVISVGEGVSDFNVGDYVACGGTGAYHADVVAVYKNFSVKVPQNINLKCASLATIASIAIQGIRQADLRFGENCVVIGLGLIGLLTLQILKATGIKSIGVDINPNQVKIAREIGADLSFERNQIGIANIIKDFTKGYGTDAVIITAATKSLDPVEFAGEICRNKGKVVIVGSVPTGFSRANYYKKELDLRMASSYGPGRYDTNYEEKGIDYPIGYVRFTANRNMQTYIDLLSSGKMEINKLITHIFSLEEVPKAYDMILEKKEPFIGVLIKYDTAKKTIRKVTLKSNPISNSNAINISFIGAGNFAQNIILPKLKNKCKLIGIITSEGNSSRYIATKYGFEYCTSDPKDILNDVNTGTVFIVTRHDTHAKYCIAALESGKNVFVEKPLALNHNELEEVKNAYERSGKGLMVGFNRRFSALTEKLASFLSKDSKVAVNIRVNAGFVPHDHWVHDSEIGGGRIIGEVCHFIDLAYFLVGTKVNYIQATALNSNPLLYDTVTINLAFLNGSMANISYFSNGNKNVPKERIEVFSNGQIFLIDDFNYLKIFSESKQNKIKLNKQDKGHAKQFELVLESLKNGDKFPISFDDIFHTTKVTLEVLRSIKEKKIIFIND